MDYLVVPCEPRHIRRFDSAEVMTDWLRTRNGTKFAVINSAGTVFGINRGEVTYQNGDMELTPDRMD